MLLTTDQGAFHSQKMQGEMLEIISDFFQENSKVFIRKLYCLKAEKDIGKRTISPTLISLFLLIEIIFFSLD